MKWRKKRRKIDERKILIKIHFNLWVARSICERKWKFLSAHSNTINVFFSFSLFAKPCWPSFLFFNIQSKFHKFNGHQLDVLRLKQRLTKLLFHGWNIWNGFFYFYAVETFSKELFWRRNQIFYLHLAFFFQSIEAKYYALRTHWSKNSVNHKEENK